MYVYVMYAESNEVLYVGKTRDMKSRMNQHFGVAKESWKEDVSYIKYMDCYTEVDMSIYEIYLINKLKPKYNSSLLYKGETLIDLNYNLKDYNDSFSENDFDISDEDKNRIKKYLVLYEDEGKSKFNSNYDTPRNIKHSKNILSSRWCSGNKDKYNKVIKNTESFYQRIRKMDKSVSMSSIYISMWSEYIDLKHSQIRRFQKYINNPNSNNNARIICYLRNDYVSNDNEKHNINNKKSIMRLINILNHSAIQENKIVYLYLPSVRMRDLLIKYLNNEL